MDNDFPGACILQLQNPDISHLSRIALQDFVVLYSLITLKLRLTVNAAVYPVLPVCKLKLMWKLLLDGSNAARILALDNIRYGIRQGKLMLLHDLCILDNIDGNAVIQNPQHIQINVKITFNLNDVLFAHFIAFGILDDRHRAVQLLQIQIFIDLHGTAGLDVIDHDSLIQSSDI